MLAETSEADTVDRPIQNHGRAGAVERHGVNQSVRMPMSARGCFHQALSPLGPASQPAHIGLERCFIHKNKPFGIDLRLTGTPVGACYDHVFAILLGSTL